jgi:hypothetical protein
MPFSLPIACSLSAEDQSKRLLEMASLSNRILGVQMSGDRDAVVEFHGDLETKIRLERMVDAERECCPFLELALSDHGSRLAVSISGPEGAEGVIQEIVGAFSRPAAAR